MFLLFNGIWVLHLFYILIISHWYDTCMIMLSPKSHAASLAFKFLEVHLAKYGMKMHQTLHTNSLTLAAILCLLYFLVNFTFWFNLIWFWLRYKYFNYLLFYVFVLWHSFDYVHLHTSSSCYHYTPLISVGLSYAWSNLWTLCICMQSYSIYRIGGGHHTNQPECSWMFTSLSTNFCMEFEIT